MSAWGWGDDPQSAAARARERALRLLERLREGVPEAARGGYGYDARPLREEIVEVVARDRGGAPSAVITRNRMGALVLNTAQLLFLDVDVNLPRTSLGERLRAWLRPEAPRRDADTAARLVLVDALARHGRGATYRVYRTAAGFRVLAIDRAFDPTSEEVAEIMRVTKSDPAFARLCRSQRSFRARLTPKPWRMRLPSAPGQHPREPHDAEAFARWRAQYEARSREVAICRFVQSVGSGAPSAELSPLIELHDRATRALERLPLA